MPAIYDVTFIIKSIWSSSYCEKGVCAELHHCLVKAESNLITIYVIT